jgi:hypothetical protein
LGGSPPTTTTLFFKLVAAAKEEEDEANMFLFLFLLKQVRTVWYIFSLFYN